MVPCLSGGAAPGREPGASKRTWEQSQLCPALECCSDCRAGGHGRHCCAATCAPIGSIRFLVLPAYEAVRHVCRQISVQWNTRDAGTPTVQYGTTPALGQTATGKTSSYGKRLACCAATGHSRQAAQNRHQWHAEFCMCCIALFRELGMPHSSLQCTRLDFTPGVGMRQSAFSC